MRIVRMQGQRRCAMNNTWSTYIQNINTLYASRTLRFSDHMKEQYKKAFAIDGRENILEIGCGPGALAESLARWYPQAQVTGIDRDSNFINFARSRADNITYMEADATALPFDAGSFDVTISNTVAEHVEPSKFYGEQHRVLKDNGVCIVLYARQGANIAAPCVAQESELEREIWQRTEKHFADMHNKYAVGAYRRNEAELPLCMERHGFRHVTTDYITVNLTPDNPAYTRDMAHAMINANRLSSLDNAQGLLEVAGNVVKPAEVEELERIIHAKYDERLRLYDQGIRQWDTSMSVTMIVRGVK